MIGQNLFNPGAGQDPNFVPNLALQGGALLGQGIKGGFLLAFGMFVLFGFVVIRQISLMNATVSTGISGVLRLVGYIYFLLTVIALLLAFVML